MAKKKEEPVVENITGKPLKKVVKKPVKQVIKPVAETVETPKTVSPKVEVKLKPKNAGAEENITGAPKNFIIKCGSCAWSRASSGLRADLADIREIKNNSCTNCGKWRKFHCPKCGSPSMMKRIKGNT